jgi:hypothetical protein
MKKILSYLSCLALIVTLTSACASPTVVKSSGNEETKARQGDADLDKETGK